MAAALRPAFHEKISNLGLEQGAQVARDVPEPVLELHSLVPRVSALGFPKDGALFVREERSVLVVVRLSGVCHVASVLIGRGIASRDDVFGAGVRADMYKAGPRASVLDKAPDGLNYRSGPHANAGRFREEGALNGLNSREGICVDGKRGV